MNEGDGYYNNFFIGIPLPKIHYKVYKKFLKHLKIKYPYLQVTKTRFPHITVLFMGKQLKDAAFEIGKIVDANKKILEGNQIKIQNFGRFENTHDDVLFLEVERNHQLDEFYYKLTESLSKYSESEWKNFVPHFTIARIRHGEKKHFNEEKDDVVNFFGEFRFEFPLEEVVLFGRDPSKHNKLVKITNYYIT